MDESGETKVTSLYLTYKDELEAWSSVNRQLKQHGLKHVLLSDPHQMLQSDDVIGFSATDSESLRDNLVVLMKDGDRRQTLIQDLIITNNQLRADLDRTSSIATDTENMITELRNQLSSAHSHVAELEVSAEQQKERSAEGNERDTNTKVVAQTRAKQLEKRCELQEAELDRLREKLHRLNDEQTKREKRVEDIFHELRRGSRKGLSSSDKRVLDIVEMYEVEIGKLKKKLDRAPAADAESGSDEEPGADVSSQYKQLMRKFSSDVKRCEKEMKQMSERNELLELELQARPHVEDYNKAKVKVRQLEKILQEHNIGPYTKDTFNRQKYSTKKEDIEFLPLNHCRRYLTLVCEELELSDLEELHSRLQLQRVSVDAFPKLEALATQIADIIEPSILRQQQQSGSKHRIWCSKHWKSVINRLEHWRQQIQQLPELSLISNKLLRQFDKSDDALSSSASVTEVISALEGIVCDSPPTNSQPVADESVSHNVLLSIVRHFQHLFDVPTVSGIYPRMSEVYSRCNEMKNVLKTLADLLDLGNDFRGSDIVDAVGRVCQSYTSSTYMQLKQLLQEDELDSVIERLDEHRNFIPIFRDVMDQLMELLDVERLDQVVPSVRALKLMVS